MFGPLKRLLSVSKFLKDNMAYVEHHKRERALSPCIAHLIPDMRSWRRTSDDKSKHLVGFGKRNLHHISVSSLWLDVLFRVGSFDM